MTVVGDANRNSLTGHDGNRGRLKRTAVCKDHVVIQHFSNGFDKGVKNEVMQGL